MMIADQEEPAPKSILDSFIEGIGSTDDRYRQSQIFWSLVDEVFKGDFDSMDSWEEWHQYLASQGIIQARTRYNSYTEEKWFVWAQKNNLYVRKSPAHREREYLLVPEKVIEKMIVLGRVVAP